MSASGALVTEAGRGSSLANAAESRIWRIAAHRASMSLSSSMDRWRSDRRARRPLSPGWQDCWAATSTCSRSSTRGDRVHHEDDDPADVIERRRAAGVPERLERLETVEDLAQTEIVRDSSVHQVKVPILRGVIEFPQLLQALQ